MKFEDIHIRDPYILEVDNVFYLYGSRGGETWGKCSGLDVYVSKDLRGWSEPTVAFTPPEDFWSDMHFWAPEVHEYNGQYYMFVSFKSPQRCRGTQILKSSSPMGPFEVHSDGPVTPAEWECLDGTMYIENGIPYMVFCHEWTQVGNGEMCVIELSRDLREAVSEPTILFRAADPAWSDGPEADKHVTDGPFLYRTESGRLIMIWSSLYDGKYCEALSYSDNGSIFGNWIHDDRLLFADDGGHGMLFLDLAGKLMFIQHQPNNGDERPCLYEVYENNDTLYIKQ